MFWMAPMGQMQPLRKKPKYAIENTERRKIPSRLRARMTSQPESARQAASTATSTYSSSGGPGRGGLHRRLLVAGGEVGARHPVGRGQRRSASAARPRATRREQGGHGGAVVTHCGPFPSGGTG